VKFDTNKTYPPGEYRLIEDELWIRATANEDQTMSGGFMQLPPGEYRLIEDKLWIRATANEDQTMSGGFMQLHNALKFIEDDLRGFSETLKTLDGQASTVNQLQSQLFRLEQRLAFLEGRVNILSTPTVPLRPPRKTRSKR
jgi:uncharacterized protein (DUF2342 family)